jgi:hypothetical protein
MATADDMQADERSMFFSTPDGRVAFYPYLFGYGYWLDGLARKAALLAAARRIDRLGMLMVVVLFGVLLVLNHLLPAELRVLPWLAWLPAMMAVILVCRLMMVPHLAGLARTSQRRFLLSPRSVATMQSMARLVFVLAVSGVAALFGAWELAVGSKPTVATAIFLGFGVLALWAALLIRTKLGMARASGA